MTTFKKGDPVEFVEDYSGVLKKGYRVVITDIDYNEDGSQEMLRFYIPEAGRKGSCYPKRVKLAEKEKKSVFDVGDRVIRTNNPTGAIYGVEAGATGTVRWVSARGRDIQVTWDNNSQKTANNSFWQSENFARLEQQKENKVHDYVTLDEAWQEGNVIEFTAEANRLGDQWSVGCKQVM